MQQEPNPTICRLYFLLARNADVGVIFRRGPAKWTQIVRWDTARDTFEGGQWFNGYLYQQQADLSPDGSLMVYFAAKNSHDYTRYDSRDYWTAVSRPPFLTALALWLAQKWISGGGLFETDKRLWLSHPVYPSTPRPDKLPTGLDSVVLLDEKGDNKGVLFQRLERDGWTATQHRIVKPRGSVQRNHWISMLADIAAWDDAQPASHKRLTPDRRRCYEKSNSNDSLTLLMDYSSEGDPCKFALCRSGAQLYLRGVEWADWDRRGRLVFARAGKIWTGNLEENDQWQETELADFNAAQPELIRAPEWATHW